MSTEFLAIYGSILATLSFISSTILAIIEFNRKKPGLKIRVSTGRLIDDFTKHSESLIMITAINSGSGTITITGLGWLTKDKVKYQVIYPYLMNLPVEINERKPLTFYYPVSAFIKFKEIDSVIGFYFQDELGKTWKCKIKRKMIEGWRDFKIDGWELIFDKKTNLWLRKDHKEIEMPF